MNVNEALNNALQTSQTPREMDALKQNSFRFIIQRLPEVSFFCQEANIPEMSLGIARQPTPFIDLKLPGEKLIFSDLVVNFMVQEDLSNYIELHDWMVKLGFPVDRSQFNSLDKEQRARLRADLKGDRGEYSDATMFIMNSDNVPVLEVLYADCFPTSLSIPSFQTTSLGAEPIIATATFAYRQYSFTRTRSTA